MTDKTTEISFEVARNKPEATGMNNLLTHANSQAMRFFRFIRLCFIQRSISRALWVDEYEQHKPNFAYEK